MPSLVEKVIATIPSPEKITNLNLAHLDEYITFKWQGVHFYVDQKFTVKNMDNTGDAACILLKVLLEVNSEPGVIEKKTSAPIKNKLELLDVLQKEEKIPIFEYLIGYRDFLQKFMRNRNGKIWITRSLKNFAKLKDTTLDKVTAIELIDYKFEDIVPDSVGGKVAYDFLVKLQDKIKLSIKSTQLDGRENG